MGLVSFVLTLVLGIFLAWKKFPLVVLVLFVLLLSDEPIGWLDQLLGEGSEQIKYAIYIIIGLFILLRFLT